LPLAGEIVEFNDALEGTPSSKCRSLWCWLDDKIKVADVADYDSLLSDEAYKRTYRCLNK
jgi:glycine cleavage system H protein